MADRGAPLFYKGLGSPFKNRGLYFSSWFVSKEKFFTIPLEENREGSGYCRQRWRRARSAERSPSAGAGLGAPRRRRRRQRATIAARPSARLALRSEAHSLQPAQSVPEPAARCLETHRGYSALRSIGATVAGPGDRRLAPRRAAGALDQEAIGRAQPVGASAACSGALALFRFGGDHAAIPPA